MSESPSSVENLNSERLASLARDLEGWKQELLNDAIEKVKKESDEAEYMRFEEIVNEQIARAIKLFNEKNLRVTSTSFHAFVAKQLGKKTASVPSQPEVNSQNNVEDPKDIGSSLNDPTAPIVFDTDKEEEFSVGEDVAPKNSDPSVLAEDSVDDGDPEHSPDIEAFHNDERSRLEDMFLQDSIDGSDADLLREELKTLQQHDNETGERRHSLEDLVEKYNYEVDNNIKEKLSLEDFDSIRSVQSFNPTPAQKGKTNERVETASDTSALESEPEAGGSGDSDQQEVEPERTLSAEERQALTAELNLITDATVDAQRDIIVRYEADLADRVRNPKYTEEEYVQAQNWLTRPKELALAIAGRDRLMGDVKIPDIAVMNAYEQKVSEKDPVKREAQKRALSREERDAYRDAFGRKKDFTQALLDSGVRKGMAYGLYNEFVDRAASLQRFKEGLVAELEAGKEVVINKGNPDYDLLKWHGIKDGPWEVIIDQINGELEQFTTIPEPVAPERPARVVPLVRPEKNEKKDDAVLPPPPEEEKAEEVAPITAPPLTGIYEVRDDGHVYNSNDASPEALRLDTDEPLPRVSGRPTKKEEKTSMFTKKAAPLLTVEGGQVTYDRELDPDLARERETLTALLKNKNLIRPEMEASQLPKESDPRLAGLYNIDNNVVRTGLTEGEGERMTLEAAQPIDINDTQEVTPDVSPQTEETLEEKKGKEKAAFEKFMTLQKIFLTDQTALMQKLNEARASGDMNMVTELEQERSEIAETYENAIAEYQKSTVTVSPEDRDELVRQAAQKTYEEEIDTYDVKETSDAPRGTPLYRELQKRAYLEEKYPEVVAAIKQLEDPMLSREECTSLIQAIKALPAFVMLGTGQESYIHDSVGWSLPQGREVKIDWDAYGNIGLTFNEGSEDIRQLRFEEEVEKIEEKEDLAFFDPKYELAKILKAPTAERPQLLAAYKDKLMWQKKGLAGVQAAMEEDIRTNPDMSQEEFVKLYMERAAEFAATKSQKEIAERVFARYAAKHEAVHRTREEYPDNKALFAALFGVEPKGEIEVIEGPMILYLRLHDLEDYALARSSESLKNTPHVTPEMIEEASHSAGCMLPNVILPGLNGCVTLENAQGKPFDEYSKEAYLHEEQHAINQLSDWKKQRNLDTPLYSLESARNAINAVEKGMAEGDAASLSLKKIEKQKAEEKLENALTQYFRVYREHNAEGQYKAKDEILAYAKYGRSFEEVFAMLTSTKVENGLYDYLADKKCDSKDILRSAGFDEETANSFVQKADEIKARVFGPEYHALLREGLDAYEDLRKEGYKEEVIRAILLEEPLGKWKKIADRLIAQETGIPEETLEKYEKQFNISEHDLKRIEGFRELTPGQQMLVLKQLNNYSGARIKGEALREYRESYNVLGKLSDKEQAFIQKGGWWRKVAIGVAQLGKGETYKKAGMALMKRKNINEREKELASQMFTGEVDQKAFLSELVRQAKDGPDAEIVEGKLELKFLKTTDIAADLAPSDAARVEAFNQVATRFSNTPHSWREYNATEEEQKKYAAMQAEYTRACHDMLELKRLKAGDEHASLALLDVERKVTFNQFFNTYPETEQMLADIKDQGVWGKWVLETAQTRGGMMALGGAIRTAAGFAASQVVAKASLVAAPLAGMVVGGIRGRKLARTEVEERELLAKIGISDASKEARNIVPAGKLTEKIHRLKAEIDALPDTPDLSPELREKRTTLMESLDARYTYTKEKIERGLVDYGGEKAIGNRYELLKAFGVAAAATEVNKHWNMELHTRLHSFIDYKEEKIEERQEDYVDSRMKTAALYGAGFGYAGAFMADYFHGLYQYEGEVKHEGEIEPPTAQNGEDQKIIPSQVASPESPLSAESNAAIEAAKRDGWTSETIRQAQADASLNKAYIDKMMERAGRKPEVGLSDMELNALQATDNDSTRATAHAALLKAMENSRLSDDEVARIMNEHRIPLSTEEVGAPHQGGEDVATLIHEVKAGDNLTNIMKKSLQIMKGLTPLQQENVIQNFIRGVSKEELKSIGLTDVQRIGVGDKIDIGKLNEVLLSKKVNGQDLFTRARALGAAPSVVEKSISQVISVPSETVSPLGGGEIKEIIGTSSSFDSSLIEAYAGRSLSASESNVLHSLKGLLAMAESEEEKQMIVAASDHLKLAMREANRPLLLGEMRRILEKHGGLDARIALPEVPAPIKSEELLTPVRETPVAIAPKVTEATPLTAPAKIPEIVSSVRLTALTPENIANWNNYTEMQKLPLAQGGAESYLKLDTDRLYGTDMFGKSAPAWLSLANRPAAEIFGARGERLVTPPSASDPFVKIIEYTKAQGFLRVNGYEPVKGETVEQFLRRAHTMKILEDGPRKNS